MKPTRPEMACDPDVGGTSRNFNIRILDDPAVPDDSMALPKDYPTDLQLEDEILIVPSGSPDSYCRLCFSEVNVEPLTVPGVSSQPKQPLIDLIQKYISVRLDMAQSCAICNTCRMMLEEFERFRERCRQCDEVLTGEEHQEQSDEDVVGQKLDCLKCKRTFKAKESLDLHVKNFHGRFGGNGKWECVHCTRIFASEGHMRFHVRSLHDLGGDVVTNGPSRPKKPRTNASKVEELPVPPLAPFQNVAPAIVDVRGKAKPYECDTCGRGFHFVGSLKRHVREAHQRNTTANETQNRVDASIDLGIPAVSYQPAERFEDMIVPDVDEPSLLPEVAEPLIEPITEQPKAIASEDLTTKFGLKTCVIYLERLHHSIPPTPNHELSLGKFFYLRQQKTLQQQSNDNEDWQKDYPGFTKSVRRRAQPKRPVIRKAAACSECGAMFTSRESLNRHMPLHTNEYPHNCDECPMGFVRPLMLEKHKQLYHVPGGRPLNLTYCPYCSRPFLSVKAISPHVELVHPELLEQYLASIAGPQQEQGGTGSGEVKVEQVDPGNLLMGMFK